METLFLACFVFGALFTVASFLLGFGGTHGAGALHHGAAAPHGHVGGHGGNGQQDLPLANASSLLAFLTLFGAVGYILSRYAAWLLVPTLVGAVLAGVAGWVLIALLLRQVLAGGREMDPDEYRLEGTIGQVTVSIPAAGAGEIVYTKAGSTRSEAARGLDGRPIARGTEVVVTSYARGFATVQPWGEFIASNELAPQEREPSTRQERPSEARGAGG